MLARVAGRLHRAPRPGADGAAAPRLRVIATLCAAARALVVVADAEKLQPRRAPEPVCRSRRIHRAVARRWHARDRAKPLFEQNQLRPRGRRARAASWPLGRCSLALAPNSTRPRRSLPSLKDGQETGRTDDWGAPAFAVEHPSAGARFGFAPPAGPKRLPWSMVSMKTCSGSLLRGRIDMLIGALRDPAPVEDIQQEQPFLRPADRTCAPDHPLVAKGKCRTPEELEGRDWIVPRLGAPARATVRCAVRLDRAERPRAVSWRQDPSCDARGSCGAPTCWDAFPRQQARVGGVALGLLAQFDVELPWVDRPIGRNCAKGLCADAGSILFSDAAARGRPRCGLKRCSRSHDQIPEPLLRGRAVRAARPDEIDLKRRGQRKLLHDVKLGLQRTGVERWDRRDQISARSMIRPTSPGLGTVTMGGARRAPQAHRAARW